MPVKTHVLCCVGDSPNSCGLGQHTVVVPSRSRFQSGMCMDLFQRIGLNARCILGEWNLDRSSAHVSHSILMILRCGSHVEVAELCGAHCKVVEGCVLSTFTDSLLP